MAAGIIAHSLVVVPHLRKTRSIIAILLRKRLVGRPALVACLRFKEF